MRTCRRMLWGHRKSLLAGEQGGSFHCTALSGSNGLPAKVLTALLPEGLPCSSRAGAWEAPASLSGPSLDQLASLVPFLDSPECSTTPVLPKSLDPFRSQFSHL